MNSRTIATRRPGESAPGHLWTTGEEGEAMIWAFAGGLVAGVLGTLALVVALVGVELAGAGRRGSLDGWGE
jgi:hypothetical protein